MRLTRWLLAVALALPAIARPPRADEPDETPYSEELPPEVAEFYQALAPYGTWFVLPDRGWVWQPAPSEVGPDFVPYTQGHWVYTDVGWTWVSDFAWGWAPFHYGRWFVDAQYGWLWQPGTEWAPAWVDWRAGAGYVGWSPLPPDGYVAPSDDWGWSFVEEPFFIAPDVRFHVIAGRRFRHFHDTRAIHERREIGHARVHAGPPPDRIAARVGRPIHPVPVQRVQQEAPLWSPRLAPPVEGRASAPAPRHPPPPRNVVPGRPQPIGTPRATTPAAPAPRRPTH
jgi:hypothetical protein